ncbi:MAG: hypothetical protein O3B01_05470 [Planctomycetota bacterium]|nr:hypothetical protein [Planctomycetota bacterium]MDA1138011.1 hypothetical protein [Planctomycetota bacterium]
MNRNICIAVFVMAGIYFAGLQAEETGPTEEEGIANRQEMVSEKFKRLEKVMLRMAESLRSADANRAAVLLKAISQSKEDMIDLQFTRLVELLQQSKLGTATKNQKELRQDLSSLLNLLLASERDERLRDEIEKIKAQIRELDGIITEQKRLKTETEDRISETPDLARRQKKLSNRSKKLAKNVNGEDSDSQPSGKESKGEDSKDSEGKDSKGSESKGSEGSESKGSEGSESKGSEGSESKGSKGSESKGSKGSKSQGSQGQSENQSGEKESGEQGADQIEQASRDMEDAKEDLDEEKNDDAAKDQKEALSKLEQARRELEEILRQLREEERDAILAALEARLHRMLQHQKVINTATVRLSGIPEEKRTRTEELEAVKLSKIEAGLASQADAALSILKEEGTAVAFPEAIMEVREDMKTVASLLAKADTGGFTQSVEIDIVKALEEMIEALQQERQNSAQQSGSQSQDGAPQDPALIELLAELKMIRSMQIRVNSRTDRVSKLLDSKKDLTPEIREAIKELSNREKRIVRVTSDLATGKNK